MTVAFAVTFTYVPSFLLFPLESQRAELKVITVGALYARTEYVCLRVVSVPLASVAEAATLTGEVEFNTPKLMDTVPPVLVFVVPFAVASILLIVVPVGGLAEKYTVALLLPWTNPP